MMIKKLAFKLFVLLPLLLGITGIAAAQPVPAATAPTPCGQAGNNITPSSGSSKSQVLGGVGEASTDNDCSGQQGQSAITATIKILSLIIGILAVLMIIVGGFQYVTSAGDSGKVGTAKKTLTYAIIGLVVAAIAQLLVHFVINEFSS